MFTIDNLLPSTLHPVSMNILKLALSLCINCRHLMIHLDVIVVFALPALYWPYSASEFNGLLWERLCDLLAFATLLQIETRGLQVVLLDEMSLALNLIASFFIRSKCHCSAAFGFEEGNSKSDAHLGICRTFYLTFIWWLLLNNVIIDMKRHDKSHSRSGVGWSPESTPRRCPKSMNAGCSSILGRVGGVGAYRFLPSARRF